VNLPDLALNFSSVGMVSPMCAMSKM